MRRTFARGVFFALDALMVAEVLYFFPRLPPVVASHFDAAGRANGWATPDQLRTILFVVLGLTNVVFLGMDLLVGRLPPDLVNLPRKDYWLSPERADETVGDLRARFLWFGSATLALLLAVTHRTIQANMGPDPKIPTSRLLTALIVYVAFSVLWAARLVLKYSRVRE